MPDMVPHLKFYRHAVLAPAGRKRVYHSLVAYFVSWGWIEPADAGTCELCSRTAEEWHHPSYERGHHDWVQRACHRCHTVAHRYAERAFIADPRRDYVEVYMTFGYEETDD